MNASDPATFGAEHCRYRDGSLWCEQLELEALAQRFGTPLYVYSKATITSRYTTLRTAFGSNARICYAVKSNGNLALLRTLAELGAGFDVVSIGELLRLQAAGVPADGVVFAGVGKEPHEIEAALAAGISFFNVETLHELPLLAHAGAAQGRRVPVAVRLNPDVDPGTHRHISTGKAENKFGLDFDNAARAVQAIRAQPELELIGYHVHLGSQVRAVGPYLEAFGKVEQFLAQSPAHRDGVRVYDLGGGFGIGYGDGQPVLEPAALAAALLPRLAAQRLQPVLEPGRYLIAEAGLLLTRVLGEKHGRARRFVLVDAGMNDLLRPALYDAFHPIAPVRPRAGTPVAADVVGPVCESGDYLARDRALLPVERGDLLAVFATGAYGAAMASNYNSRRRPAEVLVDGARATLIRRRERWDELWAAELSE